MKLPNWANNLIHMASGLELVLRTGAGDLAGLNDNISSRSLKSLSPLAGLMQIVPSASRRVHIDAVDSSAQILVFLKQAYVEYTAEVSLLSAMLSSVRHSYYIPLQQIAAKEFPPQEEPPFSEEAVISEALLEYFQNKNVQIKDFRSECQNLDSIVDELKEQDPVAAEKFVSNCTEKLSQCEDINDAMACLADLQQQGENLVNAFTQQAEQKEVRAKPVSSSQVDSTAGTKSFIFIPVSESSLQESRDPDKDGERRVDEQKRVEKQKAQWNDREQEFDKQKADRKTDTYANAARNNGGLIPELASSL